MNVTYSYSIQAVFRISKLVSIYQHILVQNIKTYTNKMCVSKNLNYEHEINENKQKK